MRWTTVVWLLRFSRLSYPSGTTKLSRLAVSSYCIYNTYISWKVHVKNICVASSVQVTPTSLFKTKFSHSVMTISSSTEACNEAPPEGNNIASSFRLLHTFTDRPRYFPHISKTTTEPFVSMRILVLLTSYCILTRTTKRCIAVETTAKRPRNLINRANPFPI